MISGIAALRGLRADFTCGEGGGLLVPLLLEFGRTAGWGIVATSCPGPVLELRLKPGARSGPAFVPVAQAGVCPSRETVLTD